MEYVITVFMMIIFFPEVFYHINYTWNIIFIFWANDLNFASRPFSFQPLEFERAIFEDAAKIFNLKIWRVCSIVPYTADEIFRLIFL